MSERNAQSYLDQFYQDLKKKEITGFKNDLGPKLLGAIEDGSLSGDKISLMLQGASVSSSDEILGYARSLLGGDSAMLANKMNSIYGADLSPAEVGIGLERRGPNQYRKDNPLKAMALEATGGLVLGPMGAGRTIAARTAQSAGTGAASGFMAGEDGLESRLKGGALGSVIGAGSQLGLDMVGSKLISPVYSALFQSGKKEATREGVSVARRALIEQIEADGMSVDEAIAYIGQQAGKDVSLADIGSNTQALVDVISVLPGPGKATATRFLRQRMEGRNGRLGTILQDAFGKRAAFYNDFQAMKGAKNDTANKLYGAANKIDIPFTPELQELLRTPALQQAYDSAARIAGNKKDNAMSFRLTPDGEILDMEGNVVSAINTRFLHFMKQGLDDVAFPKMPAQGIGATEVNAIRDLRSEFVELMDAANPMYGRARAMYAGDSAVMEAMKTGRGLLKEDPDELAARIVRMNKSEKEAFRLGALQNLQDQFDLSVESANMARNIMKSARRRQLLRLAFPDGEEGKATFEVFMDNLGRESNMAVTERAGMNSATAQRSELIGTIRNQVDNGSNLPTSGIDLIMSSLRDTNRTQSDVSLRAVSEELARVLTETNPALLPQVLADLGKGTLLDSLKRNAPSLLPQLLPMLGRGLTGPGNVGSMSGRAGAGVAPLNDQQSALLGL